MENMKKFLEEVIAYIESAEVRIDDAWKCRTIDDIIVDGEAPGIYFTAKAELAKIKSMEGSV